MCINHKFTINTFVTWHHEIKNTHMNIKKNIDIMCISITLIFFHIYAPYLDRTSPLRAGPPLDSRTRGRI